MANCHIGRGSTQRYFSLVGFYFPKFIRRMTARHPSKTAAGKLRLLERKTDDCCTRKSDVDKCRAGGT